MKVEDLREYIAMDIHFEMGRFIEDYAEKHEEMGTPPELFSSAVRDVLTDHLISAMALEFDSIKDSEPNFTIDEYMSLKASADKKINEELRKRIDDLGKESEDEDED